MFWRGFLISREWEIRFSWRPFCFPTSSPHIRQLPASIGEVYSGDITKANAVGEYCRFSSSCMVSIYFTFKIWLGKDSLEPNHSWWYCWFSMVGGGWLLLMFGFRWVFLKFSEILQIKIAAPQGWQGADNTWVVLHLMPYSLGEKRFIPRLFCIFLCLTNLMVSDGILIVCSISRHTWSMLWLQAWKIHDFTTPPNDEQEESHPSL